MRPFLPILLNHAALRSNRPLSTQVTSLKKYHVAVHIFFVILFPLSPGRASPSRICFAGICCFLGFCIGPVSPRLRHLLLPFCAFVFSPTVFDSDYGVFSGCAVLLSTLPACGGNSPVCVPSWAGLRPGPSISPRLEKKKMPIALLPPHVGPPPVSSGRFSHRYITSGVWFCAPVMRLLFHHESSYIFAVALAGS